MKKIMFVCTGNICRSAMAHAYMQYKVNKSDKKDNFLISSCGLQAKTGEHSTNNAIMAMKDCNHRSTNVAEIDIENYDLVFCMTIQHKYQLLQLYPKLKDKVYTLKEYVDNNEYKDIDDPWGYDINVYKNCAREIVDNVDKLLEII